MKMKADGFLLVQYMPCIFRCFEGTVHPIHKTSHKDSVHPRSESISWQTSWLKPRVSKVRPEGHIQPIWLFYSAQSLCEGVHACGWDSMRVGGQAGVQVCVCTPLASKISQISYVALHVKSLETPGLSHSTKFLDFCASSMPPLLNPLG